MNNVVAEDERPLFIIVDDDAAVRTSNEELMLSVGIDATAFASTCELLDSPFPDMHIIGHNGSLTQPAKFLVVLLKDRDKPVAMSAQ